MKRPNFIPGDFVAHRLNPEKRGMVSACVYSFNGYTYRVTWSPDLKEDVHYAHELIPEKAPSPIGFKA